MSKKKRRKRRGGHWLFYLSVFAITASLLGGLIAVGVLCYLGRYLWAGVAAGGACVLVGLGLAIKTAVEFEDVSGFLQFYFQFMLAFAWPRFAVKFFFDNADGGYVVPMVLNLLGMYLIIVGCVLHLIVTPDPERLKNQKAELRAVWVQRSV